MVPKLLIERCYVNVIILPFKWKTYFKIKNVTIKYWIYSRWILKYLYNSFKFFKESCLFNLWKSLFSETERLWRERNVFTKIKQTNIVFYNWIEISDIEVQKIKQKDIKMKQVSSVKWFIFIVKSRSVSFIPKDSVFRLM